MTPPKPSRLLELLVYSSMFATTGCEYSEERDGFASRAEHGPKIDACLNEDRCEPLCAEFVAPEHDVDFDEFQRCEITDEREDGVMVAVEYTYTVNCGRRPDGYVDGCVDGTGRSRSAAAWLARVAQLEAASVTAFERLVQQLARLGAPRAWIASTRRAIADEIRHARLVEALVRRLDPACPVEPPVIVDVESPTVAQLARENAVEGQAGETFGALVATCQARTATDPMIRTVFETIARDEARHAALAHQLQPWLEAQLDATERTAIVHARRDAIARIVKEPVGGELSAADRARLGIPDAARLRAAAARMFASLG